MSNKLDYFEYFNEISQFACEQSQFLYDTLRQYDAQKLPESIKHMHDYEHKADLKKSEMIAQLIKEFLPPFDRDDIVSLAELYDTVCDTIDDVLLKFYMYNITTCNEEAIVISEKIVEICQELKGLTAELGGFKKPDKLLEKVIRVNQIEDEGDKLYLNVMHDLFVKPQKNNKNLICWSNIYTCLEDCFDACENTADLIRNIIIKNS